MGDRTIGSIGLGGSIDLLSIAPPGAPLYSRTPKHQGDPRATAYLRKWFTNSHGEGTAKSLEFIKFMADGCLNLYPRAPSTSARLAQLELSPLSPSNLNLFLSTTSQTTSSTSSRGARSTPVLVIRPPAQPPLSQQDYEPPSALGVCSPEGFKSEQSISEFRPYTPSPSVSTFAPSSATSSAATTPRPDSPVQPEVEELLRKVTERLSLYVQRSLGSDTSGSVYSDPGSFESPRPDNKPGLADISSEPVGITSGLRVPKNLPSERPLSDSAVESLQVARPLSPVGAGLSSASSTTSYDFKRPTIRPSIFGFVSRWADKRSPAGRDKRSDPMVSSPPPSVPNSSVRHDSTTSSSSPFARFKNKSTDRLAAMGHVAGEEVKSSAASIKSSIFRKSRPIQRDTSPVPPLPSSPMAHLSSLSGSVPRTTTVLVADNDLPLEVGSARSSESHRPESLSSAETVQQSVPARQSFDDDDEEPIGGEPVLISSEQSDYDPISPEPVEAAEGASRNFPTPPRSRSPSVFDQGVGRRNRTGSLKDLLKRSDSTKKQKSERSTPSTPNFLSWIAQHTHRSHVQPQLNSPTRTASPELSPVIEQLSPIEATSPTRTDASRILSLVWYPPELIRSPYASDISLDQVHAPHSTPLGERELPPRPSTPEPFSPFESISPFGSASPIEQTDGGIPQPTSIFPFHRPALYSASSVRIAGASSSTLHASSSRKIPAKLRRKRRPGNKKNTSRTPPTAYPPVSKRHARISRKGSAESIAGSSIAPASSGPSQSLDTLLNSAWPEPPSEQSEVGEEQGYHYSTETGADSDSDREEYLPSPTSIGGTSTRPATPKHGKSRSKSVGDGLQDQPIHPSVIHSVLGEQPEWEADSRVTSYLTTSPTVKSYPASPAVISDPVPPLPSSSMLRARQGAGNVRPVGIIDALPILTASPRSVTPVPPPDPLPATPPARVSLPEPRASSPQPRASTTAPILRAPLPRRTTSYQSASSQIQPPSHPGSFEGRQSGSGRPSLEEGRGSLDDNRLSLENRRSTATSKHRFPTEARRDSGQSPRSRNNSNRSRRESLKSHRDSIALRKDSLQSQRSATNSQQVSLDNQIWSVPRNYHQRPTISFEFPPTNDFWRFLNEYQRFCNPGAANFDDSGYGPGGNDMSQRTGSAASGSSTRSKPDPVKDWHKTQPSSSRSSGSRTSTPYVPGPEVIERNELIIKALKNAPGALHTRFRHFGQLGVLGWSSEFSELVDEIQRCGLERQMFTTTREQALSTCKALLRLHIEIRLQMISMFLCSQIARLRRFLDAETEYSDYPNPDFPLPETY